MTSLAQYAEAFEQADEEAAFDALFTSGVELGVLTEAGLTPSPMPSRKARMASPPSQSMQSGSRVSRPRSLVAPATPIPSTTTAARTSQSVAIGAPAYCPAHRVAAEEPLDKLLKAFGLQEGAKKPPAAICHIGLVALALQEEGDFVEPKCHRCAATSASPPRAASTRCGSFRPPPHGCSSSVVCATPGRRSIRKVQPSEATDFTESRTIPPDELLQYLGDDAWTSSDDSDDDDGDEEDEDEDDPFDIPLGGIRRTGPPAEHPALKLFVLERQARELLAAAGR